MGDQDKLDQAIRGFKMKIAQNPFILSGDLYPLIADGIGGFKRDLSGIPAPVSYTNPVRITKGFVNPGDTLGSEEPKVNAESWIIEADIETTLDQGLEFDYQDYRFKILFPVFPYIKFAGVYGYGANLQKIDQEDNIL
jgi:hypothetical protein